MICPKCKSDQLNVIDSRPTENHTRRRRQCVICGARVSTVEISAEEYKKMTQRLYQLESILSQLRDTVPKILN